LKINEEKAMIRGVHTMFYSSEPDALRTFLRDKLGFQSTDVGGGWLIFDVPEAEMGCHPSDECQDKESGPAAPSGTHNISFYCDDIEKTVTELKSRGVEFTEPVADHGYGLVTHFKVPGGFAVQLYQPRYQKDFSTRPSATV
jgi:catechol 2,3-dioxygenase-like lactoylglutathione lyase family enzyme